MLLETSQLNVAYKIYLYVNFFAYYKEVLIVPIINFYAYLKAMDKLKKS
jgi:hypothetical protein